ncbi:MAG: NADH-quinone oxidoreductase subunit N [Deltaproteobacteria bacterium]
MIPSLATYDFLSILTPILLAFAALGAMALDALGAVAARFLDASVLKYRSKAVGVFTLFSLVVILIVGWAVGLPQSPGAGTASTGAFFGQVLPDAYTLFFNTLFFIAAIAAAILSLSYWDANRERGEYYILLLLAVIGMSLMASAHDLLIFFVGLETMSISVYVLVGSERKNVLSNEAAIKYLLLGAFASAVLLYGMALVYGMTGSIAYKDMALAVGNILVIGDSTSKLVLMVGISLLLVGLFFKVAAVPFHMWTPDVYEGAPTPITGFMATGVKAAAFAALVRIFITAFAPLWSQETLLAVLFILAALTMTLGNVTAIAQRNVKRMLAYSSIAHAGYLLVGLAALAASGVPLSGAGMSEAFSSGSGILFYLLAYTFMTLGAFGVLVALERETHVAQTLDTLSGLSTRRPGLAAMMAIFMFSLTGVPPFIGFAAKFYIIQSAVATELYVLSVIMVVNSAISAYYYLRILVVMYMQPGGRPIITDPSLPIGTCVVNGIMAAAVLVIGVFPETVMPLIAGIFDKSMFYFPFVK